MKTRLALLILPLLVLASCAQNNASVRIAAQCAIPTDATACTFSATCDAQWIGENVMDIAGTREFIAMVEVDNLLPNNGNVGTFKTNTNDAYVQEYDIEYAGTPLANGTGTINGSAHVPASGTAVIGVPVVGTTTGNAIAIGAGAKIQLVAKVRLKGVLADTSSFETGAFQVPITVCNGCLSVAPTCAAPTPRPVYCPAPSQWPSSSGCR